MDDVDRQITEALENMIYVWNACNDYASSKSHWIQHYEAATRLMHVYRVNINRVIHDPTTPDFLENLQRHIERLEVYRDYGLLS